MLVTLGLLSFVASALAGVWAASRGLGNRSGRDVAFLITLIAVLVAFFILGCSLVLKAYGGTMSH